MTWKAWAVRTQLHEVLNAAGRSMPSGTVVYDGPRPRGATPKQFVMVGVAGAVLDDFSAGNDGVTAAQQWANMGSGTWRDEEGHVSCTTVAWSGDTTTATVRAVTEKLVDACEAAVAANPTLNGALGAQEKAELVDVRISEVQTPKGVAVGAVLTWAYRALVAA